MLDRGRALVITAVLALVAAVLLTVFAVRLFAGPEAPRLGDDTFEANAAFLARQVAEGGPVLFQDLAGGDRDIYVQHLGPDVATGWHAIKATAPGQPRTCTLTWDAAGRVFRDTRCGTNAVFPDDGAGLERYRTSVIGNRLSIDFRP